MYGFEQLTDFFKLNVTYLSGSLGNFNNNQDYKIQFIQSGERGVQGYQGM